MVKKNEKRLRLSQKRLVEKLDAILDKLFHLQKSFFLPNALLQSRTLSKRWKTMIFGEVTSTAKLRPQDPIDSTMSTATSRLPGVRDHGSSLGVSFSDFENAE